MCLNRSKKEIKVLFDCNLPQIIGGNYSRNEIVTLRNSIKSIGFVIVIDIIFNLAKFYVNLSVCIYKNYKKIMTHCSVTKFVHLAYSNKLKSLHLTHTHHLASKQF